MIKRYILGAERTGECPSQTGHVQQLLQQLIRRRTHGTYQRWIK